MKLKTQSVKRNYIFNTAYQILSICVPLITAPYLSRTLGADGIGIQSYTNSIIAYFTMVCVLGSTTFGQRKIATERDDKEKLSTAFWNIVFFRVFMVLITLGAYAVFLAKVQEYKVIFGILTINILNVAFDISWFFQGIEEFSKVVARNLFVRVAQIVWIFLFIKGPDDLNLYIASIVGFTALANVLTWIYVPKYITKPHRVRIFGDLKDMLLLFLPTVATQVYLVLDKSMIGVITSSTYQNGCYEQSEKIARMALTVVTSAAAVVLPRVANLYNNGNQDKAKAYVYKAYRFVWLLAIPIMFGLISISNFFVPVFFGAGFDLAEILLPIFSVLVLAVSAAYVSGFSFLIPIGKQNVYTICVCVSALFNFCANLILIPKIGATGAAIASVGAEMIGAGLQILYLVKSKMLRLNKIFESFWRYLLAASIMLIVLRIVQVYLRESVLALVLLILLGCIIYFSLLLILNDSFFKDNVRSIINKCVRRAGR